MPHPFLKMDDYLDILNKAVELASFEQGDGSFFEKWLNPGRVQQREFGQQVAMQMMQNEWQSKENAKWNDEREQMKRRIEAGINPLLAGGSVSSGNANSPASVGGVPQTPDGIKPSDIVGAAAGVESLANAAFKFGTLKPTVENLTNEAAKKLVDLGLTNEQIYAWKIDNKYRDENAQIDLRIKGLNADNIAKQWEVLHAQYELMTTQLDTELAKQKELYESAQLSISQAGLADAEKLYYEKLKEKTDYDAQWQKIRIDFWKSQGFDILNSSTDAILVQMIENGKDIKGIVREMSDYYGSRMNAEENAKSEYVYRNAYNQTAGSDTAHFDYEWNTPPKTMFEFVTKAVTNVKDKLSDLGKKLNEKFSDENLIAHDDGQFSENQRVVRSEYRASYIEYMRQIDHAKTCLHLQIADCYDNKGNIVDKDKYYQLKVEMAKLDSMPQTFREFVKYVRNH